MFNVSLFYNLAKIQMGDPYKMSNIKFVQSFWNFAQSSPDHSLLPRIDFSYYEVSGPDICSLICDLVAPQKRFFDLPKWEFKPWIF